MLTNTLLMILFSHVRMSAYHDQVNRLAARGNCQAEGPYRWVRLNAGLGRGRYTD